MRGLRAGDEDAPSLIVTDLADFDMTGEPLCNTIQYMIHIVNP